MTDATRSWWRTNRRWLPAVPVALALMLAAQSYRVEDFWWLAGSHDEVASGDQGDPVEVRDPGEDAIGEFTRRFTVTLVGLYDDRDFEPDEFSAAFERIPADARVVKVLLTFEADPDQLLSGCRLTLVGSDGVEYGGGLSDPLGQFNLCVPSLRPGPSPAVLADETQRPVTGQPRPATWTVTPRVVVPADAEISSVRLSFDPPEFVTLRPDSTP